MTHAEQSERRKQIAEAIAKGDSTSDVARRFDVARSTVSRACQPWRPHAVQVSLSHDSRRERRAQIAKAASEGVGLVELCRRFEVSSATVGAACNEASERVPSDNDHSKHPAAKRHPFEVLAKLRATDKISDVQIAQECGLTRQRVQQIKTRAQELGLL